MRWQAAELLGITQEELEYYFSENIRDISDEEGVTKSELIDQIRHWYNGYSWYGKHKVYNPFSLLNYFMMRKFDNFCFKMGMPIFLGKEIQKRKLYNLDKVGASDIGLSSYDIENIGEIAMDEF